MGILDEFSTQRDKRNAFVCALVNDIKALEEMLDQGIFDVEVQRIGAEQELCFVDQSWRPAHIIMDVLAKLNDKHYTTEHSQYNLEINLDPLPFAGDCLQQMEQTLVSQIGRVDEVVADLNGGTTILTGILPTIRRSDLSTENLTPLPRYHQLNKIMNELKGGPYEFRIAGIDELITNHNSIMFEGCNTSFQVHLQIDPATMIDDYNWAQAISAPVLASAVNSPMLLGKRLWQETRIALFQQSVDTRRVHGELVNRGCRITFGDKWAGEPLTRQFREDLARYRVLIASNIEEDSLQLLKNGEIPKLKALCVHNSTVYRWNRMCYGITEGRPHLRIENRYLPAGPSIVDQMANTAFWLGLMKARPYDQVASKMEFEDARQNFRKACIFGLDSRLSWFGKHRHMDQLILEELLPMAKEGLQKAKIEPDHIDRYLGIIKARVEKNRTGSHWILNSFNHLKKDNQEYEAIVALTAGMAKRQKENKPVHEWSLAEINEAGEWLNRYGMVGQIMTCEKDLFTVHLNDPVYMAANVMSWRHLRYIMVEDQDGKFHGIVTASALLAYFSESKKSQTETLIKEVMIHNPQTVDPQMRSVDALVMMRKHRIGCLPVTRDQRLLGLLTEYNFIAFSEYSIQKLIEEDRASRTDETPHNHQDSSPELECETLSDF